MVTSGGSTAGVGGGHVAGLGKDLVTCASPRESSRAKSVTLTRVGKLRDCERQRVCDWQSSSVKLAKSRWNFVTAREVMAIELRRESRERMEETFASSS